MTAVLRIDQLRSYAQATPRPTHTSLEHRAHAEALGDQARVVLRAFTGEARGARRDTQPLVLREHIDDLLGDAVREVLVVRGRTQIDERQHGDGFGRTGDRSGDVS